MKKLYPSSSAFVWDGTVITDYPSGCLRHILLGSKGVRTSGIPAVYMRVGAAHEENHEAELKSQGIMYNREVPIKIPIQGFDDVQYSGRIDFLCHYDSKIGEVVHETKGTVSKNTRLKVLRKGLVVTNQLAQLVSYMVARKICFGKLVCGYYEEDAEGILLLQESRTFKILIDDAGAVLIDGLPSGYTVFDQIAHRTAAATVLTEGIIADRPAGFENPYSGPCARCEFKDTCNSFDAGRLPTVDDFIESAKKDLEIAEINGRADPQPNKIKVKKEKKNGKYPKV